MIPLSDDGFGYELDDPKHPTYYGRATDKADADRKAAKERPPVRVQLDDGRAAEIAERWNEPTVWDGKNQVGMFTREEFRQADLAQTRTGLWVIIPSSSWQGERPRPYEVDDTVAAGWFAACELELPADLESEVV